MKHNYLLCVLILCLGLGHAQSPQKNIRPIDKAILQEALSTQSGKDYLTSDIQNWEIQSDASSLVKDMWHYYIVQTYNGIEVNNTVANLTVKQGKATLNNSRFVKNLNSKITGLAPSILPLDAVNSALDYYNLVPSEPLKLLRTSETNEYVFSKAGVTQSDIKVRLVYEPNV